MRGTLLILVACACAHAVPQQLTTARDDYAAARIEGAPDDLRAAGAALARANREFEEHGDTVRVRDLSYAASRLSDVARSHARANAEKRRAAELTAEAAVLRQQERAMAEGLVAPPPPPPPAPGTTATTVAATTAAAPTTAAAVPTTAAAVPTTAAAVPTTAAAVPTTATAAAPQVEVAVSPPSPGPAAQGRTGPALSRPNVSERPAATPPAPFTAPSLSFASVSPDDPRGTVITIPAALLYAPGGDGLSDTAYARLDQVADALKAGTHRVTVTVHTDNLQPAELAQKRAEVVRDYLVEHGVAADRIEATSAGSSSPLVDNSTPANRAKNRRVDVVVHSR